MKQSVSIFEIKTHMKGKANRKFDLVITICVMVVLNGVRYLMMVVS